MRKFIFIVLSILLLLSFTVLVYAEEPQIKLGGRILVRGWYFHDVDMSTGFYLPVDTTDHSVYSTNAFLTVDAKVADNVQGFMEIETCSNDIGTSGLYFWGTHDQKPFANLLFRQLWIQYTGSGLLGVPSGMKVGHQLLTLGEKQFLNHERFGDDAILVFVQPTKEIFLAALTGKLSEGSAWQDNTDDLDIYTVLGTYKIDKDNTIGANYSYISLNDLDLSFQNLGFHANGLVAEALSYAAEFDIQFGSVCEEGNVLCPYNDKIKYRGYGFMAKAGYKVDPVNLRASFAYGSGDNDDPSDTNKIREFQVTMGSDAVSPFARFVHYTQIYERTVATSSRLQTLAAGQVRSTGIANTTYYNLGVDVIPIKDVSLSADGFIIRASKTPNGISKSVGTEVDFKGSYKIAKNLSYFVEAGYFDPADYYHDAFKNPDGSGIHSKSVTQVIHGINLTF